MGTSPSIRRHATSDGHMHFENCIGTTFECERIQLGESWRRSLWTGKGLDSFRAALGTEGGWASVMRAGFGARSGAMEREAEVGLKVRHKHGLAWDRFALRRSLWRPTIGSFFF